MGKPKLAVLALCCCLGSLAEAQVGPDLPKCGQRLSVNACVCGGEVREGDRAALPCEEPRPARTEAPSSGEESVHSRIEALRAATQDPEGFWSGHFGANSVEVQGAYIDGADGPGAGGLASLGFFKSKYVTVQAAGGASQMGGIESSNVQNLGPADPNFPAAGTIQARSLISAPPTIYRKYGSVQATPFNALSEDGKLGFLKSRVRPFGEVTVGTVRPVGPAWVHTAVGVVGPDGSFTTLQALPPYAQPLDASDARRRLAATLGGGANVRLDENDRYDLVAHVGYAPTGWKEYSLGLQVNKPASAVKDLFRRRDGGSARP